MSAAGQAQGFPDYIIVPPDAPTPPSATTAPTEAAPAPAPRAERSPALPLLALVIGLAGAAIWFVGLPQLDKSAPVQRSCEVIVLQSGKTRCVKNPAAAKAQKAEQAARAKK